MGAVAGWQDGGKTHVDLRLALRKIGTQLKIRKLMLQGGGAFNGAMLKAGLVDEISLVTVPVVDGGAGVTSVFEIADLPSRAAAKLRVITHRTLRGGVQWVRYKVT